MEICHLISKTTLQNMGAIIDIRVSTHFAFGCTIPLHEWSSNHLLLNLKAEAVNLAMITTKELTGNEVKKLHVQFGHCSEIGLKRLIRDSGRSSRAIEKIIDAISQNYVTSMLYSKSRNKPISSFHQVSMNVWRLTCTTSNLESNKWCIHKNDVFSRLSNAQLIDNKKAEIIIQVLLLCWGSIYGVPSVVSTDNGGDFNNEHFRSIGGIYTIRIRSTAAYSPWSNGICKRHNALLTSTS